MTNETHTTDERPEAASTAEWRAEVTARETGGGAGGGVPSVSPAPSDGDVSRRKFLRGSFFTGLGITLLGSVGLMVDYLYPRHVQGFGGPVPAGKVSDYPKGGQPQHNLPGQFWIANLDPNEKGINGTDGASGILALWHKCPHLGCTVPWRQEFEFDGVKGWYRCPCHGSTYTKAGIRVFGPAPHGMWAMQVDIDKAGNIVVQTGKIVGFDHPKAETTPV